MIVTTSIHYGSPRWNSRVTLHTTEPTCTQPSIAQHTTGQVADKMAARERVDSAPKQADFVHLNVSQEQSLSKHTLRKTNNCSEYSKVKNAICKHARLSKQIGPVVWNTSSGVCRACIGRIYARLCAQCATN